MSNELKRDLMEDADDAGLKAIMGGKFQDLSNAASNLNAPERLRPVKNHDQQAHISDLGIAADKNRPAMDGQWAKPNTASTIAKLKACVKSASIYSGISLLLFWWQQTGMLASKAAIPSFIVLALLAGLQIGRVCHE